MEKVNRVAVKNFLRGLKPLISVIILVGTLMTLVILKMEERRRGYELLKLSRIEQSLMENEKKVNSQFAKLIKPQQIEKSAAQSSAFKRAENKQIIQLSSPQLQTVREKGLN